jgi:opacity protein-like surface antigen
MTTKIGVVLFLLAVSSATAAAVLKPATAASFEQYVKLTEQRIDSEVSRSDRFLWIDGLPANRRRELEEGLHQGGVIIERLETRDGKKEIEAPDGLIHHWVGLVFATGVHVSDAVALMQDYDRHSRIFAPNIAASKLLERDGDRFRVALRFTVKKVITVTLDTENDAQFFNPAPDRAYSRLRTTRVIEIADVGTPNERPKPAGEEHGFMWNLNTYWRFLERDGGTYIQCESLTLSRDLPFGLAWIIKPFITQVPRESLNFTMARARGALLKR